MAVYMHGIAQPTLKMNNEPEQRSMQTQPEECLTRLCPARQAVKLLQLYVQHKQDKLTHAGLLFRAQPML